MVEAAACRGEFGAVGHHGGDAGELAGPGFAAGLEIGNPVQRHADELRGIARPVVGVDVRHGGGRQVERGIVRATAHERGARFLQGAPVVAAGPGPLAAEADEQQPPASLFRQQQALAEASGKIAGPVQVADQRLVLGVARLTADRTVVVDADDGARAAPHAAGQTRIELHQVLRRAGRPRFGLRPFYATRFGFNLAGWGPGVRPVRGDPGPVSGV